MTFKPEDDLFHAVVKDPPDWAETAWFAANVPERDLVIWFYPLFRRDLGVMSCGIYVFGPGYSEPWEMLYYKQAWHMPIPADAVGACEFQLPNSLAYTIIEPLRKYHISYHDGDEFTADLTFSAFHEPHPVGVSNGVGHIDQFGRVQGEVVLHGERIVIDGVEMRDRTWGPRREDKQMTRLGYSYGADVTGRGFHSSVRADSSDVSTMLTGFLLHDGQETPLTSVQRNVQRDDRGRPARVDLVLTTSQETLRIAGEVRGQMTVYTSPYVVPVSFVAWTLPDGTVVYGEDQDTWSPGRFRKFRKDQGYLRELGTAAGSVNHS